MAATYEIEISYSWSEARSTYTANIDLGFDADSNGRISETFVTESAVLGEVLCAFWGQLFHGEEGRKSRIVSKQLFNDDLGHLKLVAERAAGGIRAQLAAIVEANRAKAAAAEIAAEINRTKAAAAEALGVTKFTETFE